MSTALMPVATFGDISRHPRHFATSATFRDIRDIRRHFATHSATFRDISWQSHYGPGGSLRVVPTQKTASETGQTDTAVTLGSNERAD